MKIYRCQHCGSMLWQIHDGSVPVCCGETMSLLQANTTDAATEKHIPVITESNGKITATVGEVEHPMTEEHHIEWIAAVSENRVMKKDLKPGEKPELTLCALGWESFNAYCNLHGLWKAEVK